MIEERPMPLKPKPMPMGGLEVDTSVTGGLESTLSTSLLPTSADLQRMRQDWNGILSRSNSRSMSGGTKNYISEVYEKFKRPESGISGNLGSIVENTFSKGGLLGDNNGGILGSGLGGVTKNKSSGLLFEREIVSVEKRYEPIKAVGHSFDIDNLTRTHGIDNNPIKRLNKNVLEISSTTFEIPRVNISQIPKAKPILKINERVDLSETTPHLNINYYLKKVGRDNDFMNITDRIKEKKKRKGMTHWSCLDIDY